MTNRPPDPVTLSLPELYSQKAVGDRAGLRIDLGPVAETTRSELVRVAEVLAACRSGDLRPAVEYLDSSGWQIRDTDCWLDLGANLGAALTRRPPAQAGRWAA